MTIKVFDTFTGSVGTDLAAHTPDTDVVGGGWTDASTNTVELDGSGAVQFSAANDNSRIDTGTADQWATVNLNAGGAANRFAIYLRFTNAVWNSGSGYYFNPRPDSNSLYIYRVDSGSNTVLTSRTDYTMSTSTTYSFEPSANGSTIDFAVDGSSELSTTDATYSTGDYFAIRHALYTDGALRVYDVQVDDAAPGGGANAPTGNIHGCLFGPLGGVI